jgi:hypothetical protein
MQCINLIKTSAHCIQTPNPILQNILKQNIAEFSNQITNLRKDPPTTKKVNTNHMVELVRN